MRWRAPGWVSATIMPRRRGIDRRPRHGSFGSWKRQEGRNQPKRTDHDCLRFSISSADSNLFGVRNPPNWNDCDSGLAMEPQWWVVRWWWEREVKKRGTYLGTQVISVPGISDSRNRRRHGDDPVDCINMVGVTIIMVTVRASDCELHHSR